MNYENIDDIISMVCKRICWQELKPYAWKSFQEEELMREIAICIFSSQMLFELSVGMADKLEKHGYFKPSLFNSNLKNHESQIVALFSEPVKVEIGENIRWMKPRFKNRLAKLLTTSFGRINEGNNSIKKILCSTDNPSEARENLIEYVSGFGPKQSSLFLRRIGYSDDFAILDTHIIDYLNLATGNSVKKEKLGQLPFYEKIEKEFSEITRKFDYPLGCVDLATWLTMRVAKAGKYL